MKRITTVCIALAALVSFNAYAGDAYTAVMGTGDPNSSVTAAGGSLINHNSYNIFYNPSYANDFKNWMTVERRVSDTSAPGISSSASGGFVRDMSGIAFGAFYGRPTVGGSGMTISPLDIIVAGDAGMKWGVGLTYNSHKNGTDNTDTAMAARVGLQIGDIHPFVGFQFIGNDKTSATVTNKTTVMQGGFKYMWGEYTPYFYVSMQGFTPQGGTKAKTNNWGLGVSRSHKAGDTSTMTCAIGVHGNTVTASATSPRFTVPVDLTFETEFTSWLVGRAGLHHSLVDRQAGVSFGDSTTGRAGGTVKFGKAEMEFAVGGSGGTGIDSDTFDFANGLFTAANFTYKF